MYLIATVSLRPSLPHSTLGQARTGQIHKRHVAQMNLQCLPERVPSLYRYLEGMLDLGPRCAFPLHLTPRVKELAVIYRSGKKHASYETEQSQKLIM